MKSRILHMEQSEDDIILRAENLSIPQIGELIGDCLNSVCNDKRMLGDSTPEDAKDVLMNIILAKLGYIGGNGSE